MQKKILSFEVKNIFRRIPRSTRCWGTLGFSALHVLFAYTEMTAGTRFGKSRTLFFLRKTSFSSFWWRVTLVTTRRKHHGEVKWEKKIIILNYSLDYFLVDVGIVISATIQGWWLHTTASGKCRALICSGLPPIIVYSQRNLLFLWKNSNRKTSLTLSWEKEMTKVFAWILIVKARPT